MTGKERRTKMDQAIKEIVIPFLRQKEFKGSYPHFRREKDANLNLLTFQFSFYASKFVVEISNCPINNFETSWGKIIKSADCRVHYMGNRLRLGSKKHNRDYWFEFENETVSGNIYHKRANEIIEYWDEAEKWWGENPYRIGID